MPILTDDMRRLVEEQSLGFVATVCPDGTPNLSPKGTTAVFDEDHLVWADIRSPATIRNLAANPAMEVNVVDPILRKGYRFKGVAEVFAEGPQFDAIVAFFRARGSTSAFRHVVRLRVQRAAPLISPAYDQGRTEAEVAAQWEQRYAELKAKRG
ncbi:MAG TPA: pyridoxamine 5'-phosphate oxidase family protein [Caulobacteraceae bacterium]|nr:pyridoxamine 5'-phosphate oxidase family protein [Caulobacteraceae bacterium]